MIAVENTYSLIGALFAAFAVLSLHRDGPRRWLAALFWLLLTISMWFGGRLGDVGNGVLALALAVIAAFGAPGAARAARAAASPPPTRGAGLFAPAVAVPVLTVAGTLFVQHTAVGHALVGGKQATLTMLALACVLVLLATMIWLRTPPATPLREGHRLMEAIGWAALMPQMLAALGAVFLAANVGGVIGEVTTRLIPLDTPLAACAVYCLGMALFTVIMGNAFAAFPVMTAAIGLPLLVGRFGGDPAVICAIGMLAGFCGTLLTPMAANFNVVPANLLELPDRHRAFNGVIRAQAPTALAVLVVNIALMRLLAFRF